MKQSSNVEFNAFIAGYVTEASPLNFPPNASYDEENFELNKKGIRSRRKGMDYEDNNVLINSLFSSTDTLNPITYRWTQPAGIPDKNFLVIQEKNTLTFIDLGVESLSGEGVIGSVTLSEFPETIRFSITSVDGNLIIASGYSRVAIVKYLDGVFSAEYVVLRVRDIWGVAEPDEGETDASFRATTVNGYHRYNLQNQSWGIPRKNKDNVLVDPVDFYFDNLAYYPSNSEMVWPGLQFQQVAPGNDPFERLYSNLYEEVLGANTIAAKGYYIIDVMNRGASRLAQFEANKVKYPTLTYSSVYLPTDATPSDNGPKLVSEFSGRVFYAGFGGEILGGDKRSPNLTNHVLFSRLVRHSNDYGSCFQEGDPSSREASDVVDTDGGFIRIAGCETILGMVTMANSLLVIASNGVWAITGGNDYGFTATNYRVDKISSYGGISRFSLVEDGSSAYFWAEEAIYQIAKTETGGLAVNNITRTTIESFYQSIPNEAKRDVISVYDPLNRRIRWIYHTGVRFTETSETIELILDLNLGAFYKFRIQRSPNNLVQVLGAFSSPKFVALTDSNDVLAGVDEVLSDVDEVIYYPENSFTSLQAVRYLVYELNAGVLKYSFAFYKEPQFIDWPTEDGGSDAFAFMMTGDTTASDSSKVKQIPYAVIHFERTETGVDDDGELLNPSSCLIRSQWDWSTAAYSGKWGQLREAYRYARLFTTEGNVMDTGFKVLTTKNKLRGRGKSFALYMETSPLKNCIILGWNLTVNGNALS